MNRGVKSFFVKGIIFVTPLLLLLGLIEYKLYHIPNGYNTKRKLLERQLDSIQVLVAGSSQTLHGINPAYFSCRGFNVANNSQSLFYDTQIALKYIDRMKQLKCVMVTISYFCLWNQLSDLPEDWRDSFYYYYWDIKYPGLKMLNAKNYSLIMLYGTQNALQYTTELFHVDLTENMSKNGWIKIDTIHNNPQISDESGRKRVQFHNKISHPYRFAENIAILENFIIECKKRNVDVAFVTPPVYKTYYNYIDTEMNRKNVDAIKSLCQRYGCTYHDYLCDQRFTSKDFNDNDHLNYMGAAKWSAILDSDVVVKYSKNKPALKNQPILPQF
jgi:hypothetical protein